MSTLDCLNSQLEPVNSSILLCLRFKRLAKFFGDKEFNLSNATASFSVVSFCSHLKEYKSDLNKFKSCKTVFLSFVISFKDSLSVEILISEEDSSSSKILISLYAFFNSFLSSAFSSSITFL